MRRAIVSLLIAAMAFGMTGCGGASSVSSAAVSSASADLVGSYTYEEKLPFGTIPWTLDLAEDGTYILTFSDMMGKSNRYTGTYTAENGTVVTSVPNEGGDGIQASFFNEDFSCEWMLNADGTLTPAHATDEAGQAGGPIGMPGASAAESNADYKAVAYADNAKDQVMDIYKADSATGKDPVIVVIHGGGFKFGDQSMPIIQPIIEAGTAHGYVVASVDYRKSGEAAFPAAVGDVKAAVRYLKAHAEEYGIDPERIVVWGESAGAYLAAMTATTPQVDALNADVKENLEQDSNVAALVDFYGPNKFQTMDEEFVELGDAESANHSKNSFESDFVGVDDLSADPDKTAATWWYTYKEELPTGLYVWIQAGTADKNVPYTQSENFAKELAEQLGEDHVRYSTLEGAEHEDDRFYTEENLNSVFAFLQDVLK